MASFGMDDYNTVPERIAEFRKKYPTGTLQPADVKLVRDFGGADWIRYTAAAYRTPDDERPGMGTVMERVPGLTPYTKNSEMANAETSAWGRAIVAVLAADVKKGIASREEVVPRSAERDVPPAAVAAPDGWRALVADATTVPELSEIHRQATEGGWLDANVTKALSARKKALVTA